MPSCLEINDNERAVSGVESERWSDIARIVFSSILDACNFESYKNGGMSAPLNIKFRD